MHVCFCCACFSFLVLSQPRDWLGITSPKWPTLCRVGCKTTTQQLNLCFFGQPSLTQAVEVKCCHAVGVGTFTDPNFIEDIFVYSVYCIHVIYGNCHGIV